jgi:hypothetical protein
MLMWKTTFNLHNHTLCYIIQHDYVWFEWPSHHNCTSWDFLILGWNPTLDLTITRVVGFIYGQKGINFTRRKITIPMHHFLLVELHPSHHPSKSSLCFFFWSFPMLQAFQHSPKKILLLVFFKKKSSSLFCKLPLSLPPSSKKRKKNPFFLFFFYLIFLVLSCCKIISFFFLLLVGELR